MSINKMISKTKAFIKGPMLVLGAAAVVAVGFMLWVISTRQLPPIWPVETLAEYQSQSGFDLASQRWMAISSVITALTAMGTLVLLGWTLIITRQMLREAQNTTGHAADTLAAARKQAIAAERAAILTEQLAQKQEQAYVDASEATVSFRIEDYSAELQYFSVVLRNTGKTPATGIVIAYDYEVLQSPLAYLAQDELFNNMELESTISNLPPGNEVQTRFSLPSSIYDIYNRYVLFGEIYYSTIYGQHYVSQFAFSVDIDKDRVPVMDEYGNDRRDHQSVEMHLMSHYLLKTYEPYQVSV